MINKNIHTSHINYFSCMYIFAYLCALISSVMPLTLFNGNLIYDVNPTINYFMMSIGSICAVLSIMICIIIFILYHITYTKIFDKFSIIFGCILIIIFMEKVLHINIISSSFLLIYLLILDAIVINAKLFLKINCIFQSIILILVIAFYYFNMYPSSNSSVFYRNDIVRYSIGFAYPTILAGAILGVILSYVLLFKNKRIISNWVLVIIIGFFGFIFYYLTDTRGLELSIILLIILLLFCNNNKFKDIIERITPYVIVISLILSLALIMYYNNNLPFSGDLNNMMSGRLMYESSALKAYPVKIFNGNTLSFMSVHLSLNNTTSTIIDNSFIDSLITSGILGTVIYECFYVYSGIIAKRQKNYLLCCVLLATIVQFFFETDYNQLWLDVPYIYAFALEYKIAK